MDPDQTAVRSGSTLFATIVVFGILRVKRAVTGWRSSPELHFVSKNFNKKTLPIFF